MKFEYKVGYNWYRVWFSDDNYDFLDVYAKCPNQAIKYARATGICFKVEKVK